MKYLILILLFASSCQREISCEDWDMCPDKQPGKCIEGRKWTLPSGQIDCCEHIVFTPSGSAYIIMAHPDFMSTWGDSCMPMNVKDSAGWYRVVNKDVHRYNGNESPYVQIGGYETGGWGQTGDPANSKTYFFMMDFPEWDSITKIFKPQW